MSKGSSSMRHGGSRRAAVPPDERLVMPETRHEIIDGRVTYVPPADEPHGTRHSKVAALVEAHVVDTHDVAADMLTRTSDDSDIAPDVSVFPRARDRTTGGRRLEELAFEILSTQKLGVAARKAHALSMRGVRRVFAIDVRKKRALVWAPRMGTWELLPSDGAISDPLFVTPLPIEALVGAASSDDAVAAALLAKRNPILEREGARRQAAGIVEGKAAGIAEGKATGIAEGKAAGIAEGRAAGIAEGKAAGIAEGRAAGIAEGKALAVLLLLDARGIGVSAIARAKVLAMTDEPTLDRWMTRATRCESVDDLFDSPRRRPKSSSTRRR